MTGRWSLGLGLALLLTGCGGSSSSSDPSVNLSGTYRATVSAATGQSVSGTVICNQVGSVASCSYGFPGVDAGTLALTVSGSSFSGTGQSNSDPTPCPISGSASGGGASFQATFSCPGQRGALAVSGTHV